MVEEMGSGASYLAPMVRFSRALQASGRGGGVVDFVGNLGTAKFNNIERDLHCRAQGLFGLQCKPYYLPLTVVGTDTDIEQKEFYAFNPYEMFESVYQSGPQFEKTFLGRGTATVSPEEYWDAISWGRDHFVNTDPEYSTIKHLILPLMTHVDGCQIFKGITYSIWSVSSALASLLHSYDKQLPCLIIDEDILVDDITIPEIVWWVIWNFKVLMSGKHPWTDHLGNKFSEDDPRSKLCGQELASGWRCAFSDWQGDGAEEIKVHGFERNYSSNFICKICLGCRHQQFCNAYDFRDGADWMDTRIAHTVYLATHCGTQLSPYSNMPGWDIYSNLFDLLHLLWLGIAKDFAASLLLVIASKYGQILFGTDDLADALFELWKECKRWHKDRKITCPVRKFTPRTLSWSSNNDYPTIESRIKGANSKLITLWGCHASIEIANQFPSEQASLIGTAAWGFLKFVYICDHSGMFFTREEADDAFEAGHMFLLAYQKLAWASYQNEECLWKVRPKTHYFMELLFHIKQTRRNPKYYDLFGAEDYMGKVKKCGTKTHRSTTSQRTLQRLWIFLSHRWWKERRNCA